jgi:hypothetical protein
MKKNISIISTLGIIVAFFSGCVDNTIPPGWPPAANPVASPVITSISPTDSAIGGVLDITINGSNFGTLGQCLVYFGTERGIITSFSSNKIVTLRPITYGVNISARVVVQLADDVAQKNYTIKRVVTPFASFPAASTSVSNTALASDTSGNIYVALMSARDITGAYKVIRKISANGILSDYATYLPSLAIAYMRIGSNGTLYALMTGSSGDFYSVAPGGGSLTRLFSFKESILCFDFDQNGVIYTGGSSGANNSIDNVQKLDTVVVKGPSYTNFSLRAVRVFQNYVYVLAEAGATDTIHVGGVYRHQILGGTLGTQELVLAWSATGDYAASKMKDLTFSANGDMYIATNKSVDPIALVSYSTGVVTGVRPLYKNLITTASGALTWTKNILYERVVPPTGGDPSITAIDMGNYGAPYYGR